MCMRWVVGVAQHNPVNFHGIRKLSDPLEDIPNEIALDETELQAEKVELMIVLLVWLIVTLSANC